MNSARTLRFLLTPGQTVQALHGQLCPAPYIPCLWPSPLVSHFLTALWLLSVLSPPRLALPFSLACADNQITHYNKFCFFPSTCVCVLSVEVCACTAGLPQTVLLSPTSLCLAQVLSATQLWPYCSVAYLPDGKASSTDVDGLYKATGLQLTQDLQGWGDRAS